MMSIFSAIEKLDQGKLIKGVYCKKKKKVGRKFKKATEEIPCLIYKDKNYYIVFIGECRMKFRESQLVNIANIDHKLKYLEEVKIENWKNKKISELYDEIFLKEIFLK